MDLYGPDFSDSEVRIFSDFRDILATRFSILWTRIGSLKHLKKPDVT